MWIFLYIFIFKTVIVLRKANILSKNWIESKPLKSNGSFFKKRIEWTYVILLEGC